MAKQSRLTILGLYKWDTTLFDLLNLPGDLDKDALVSLLVTRCATLEILYPNPEVMKNLIGLWSIQSQYTWNKLYNSMLLDYDPIANYDRTETHELSSRASGESRDSGEDKTENEGNTNFQVAGFNTTSGSPTLADKEKDSSESTTTTTYGRKNNNTYDKNDFETIIAKGNIGVTSSQELLEQERKIAMFNIYDEIITDFKKRFCILVYG